MDRQEWGRVEGRWVIVSMPLRGYRVSQLILFLSFFYLLFNFLRPGHHEVKSPPLCSPVMMHWATMDSNCWAE